jgi:hypothetical protein
MINIIKSEDRHTADFGWLQTRWHFSFGDYRDPANVVEAARDHRRRRAGRRRV